MMNSRHSVWRRLFILLAVLALTLSLAARYTSSSHPNFSGNSPSISSDSSAAKTQHLLGDGFQWTAPIVAILMLIVPRRVVRVQQPVLPLTNPYPEKSLYNRPPPSC